MHAPPPMVRVPRPEALATELPATRTGTLITRSSMRTRISSRPCLNSSIEARSFRRLAPPNVGRAFAFLRQYVVASIQWRLTIGILQHAFDPGAVDGEGGERGLWGITL